MIRKKEEEDNFIIKLTEEDNNKFVKNYNYKLIIKLNLSI